MRELNIGTKQHTVVQVMDEPSHGNACHEYEIVFAKARSMSVCDINFQNGPVKEFGINGIHNEDLIAIVIDRLQGFQSSEYRCNENGLAIGALQEAMTYLRARTDKRKEAGIEGTSEKLKIKPGDMPDYGLKNQVKEFNDPTEPNTTS